jgi:hypothetical protein
MVHLLGHVHAAERIAPAGGVLAAKIDPRRNLDRRFDITVARP